MYFSKLRIDPNDAGLGVIETDGLSFRRARVFVVIFTVFKLASNDFTGRTMSTGTTSNDWG